MVKSINADICYPFKQVHGSSPFVFTVIYLNPPLLRVFMLFHVHRDQQLPKGYPYVAISLHSC